VRSTAGQLHLQSGAVRHGARLVPCLEDLTEVVRRKNDRIVLFGGMYGDVTNVVQVRANGQMRAMLFHQNNGSNLKAGKPTQDCRRQIAFAFSGIG
jgi:hypothetical protein